MWSPTVDRRSKRPGCKNEYTIFSYQDVLLFHIDTSKNQNNPILVQLFLSLLFWWNNILSLGFTWLYTIQYSMALFFKSHPAFLLFVLIAALKFHTLDTVEASAKKKKKNNKKLLCNHFERSVEQLSGWCEKRCLAADSVALFRLIELKSINTSGAMDISYNM